MPRVNGAPLLNRRQLLGRGFGTTVALGGVPALLAACGDDEEETPQPRAEPAVDTRPPADGEAIVGDVLDFALTSDEWEGAFGFVSMRLHEGVVDGESVWFVRTDASDETFAPARSSSSRPGSPPSRGTASPASWWWSRTAQRCSPPARARTTTRRRGGSGGDGGAERRAS